jgi:glutamine cyclotransferase
MSVRVLRYIRPSSRVSCLQGFALRGVLTTLFCMVSLAAMQAAGSVSRQTEASDEPAAERCSARMIAKLQSEATAELLTPVSPTSLQGSTDGNSAVTPTRYGYRVINRYPHDETAFTQGLVFLGNRLYESTGLFGKSTLRKVDLQSGNVLQLTRLEENVFGEGLTVLNNRLIQLTWRAGVAFVYDINSLRKTGQFHYHGEGWGSTTIDDELIVSNGSAILTWLTPEQHRITHAIHVREGSRSVQGLNELEYVEGKVLANVWPSDCIAEIDQETGQITGWIDLTGLYREPDRPNSRAILNGIAYDKDKQRLFVTGKLWPYVYEIERVAANPAQRTAPLK